MSLATALRSCRSRLNASASRLVQLGESSQMKFVTFSNSIYSFRGGVLDDDRVHPFVSTEGDGVLAHIRSGKGHPDLDGSSLPIGAVKLHAPLQNPPRIFGIGLNYRDHATESKMAVQSVPTVFLKLASSVTGPDTDVLLPPEATQPDYEAELAVVIGKRGYRISPECWEQYVFGYTIVNDVSARGVQLATSQWTLGKSFPTFTPVGPSIVTRDEVPDPNSL